MRKLIPLIIGVVISFTLFTTVGWWGFLIIFPWIGFSISLGIYLAEKLPNNKKTKGRQITILMILPILLFFVPIVNNENFQLEGIILLISIGFFSKGFIHFAIAKAFGPLIWGRGFCGWACWTAAVLDWLPIKKQGHIPEKLKLLRYITFAISIFIPIFMIIFLSFDVKENYLNKKEMLWMFSGNIIYYTIGIPLAFIFRDRRAFCKIACPVAVVMKIPAYFSLIKIKPTGKKCLECSKCNLNCPMDVDVMSYISKGTKIKSTECIYCKECALVCPVGAIQ